MMFMVVLCRCVGIVLVYSVIRLGMVVFRLMLVVMWIINRLLKFYMCVVVIEKMLNSVVVRISMCLWLM